MRCPRVDLFAIVIVIIVLVTRSDDIALAPLSETHHLRDDGLTTVLDLRSPVERERTENAGVVVAGFDRHELPFLDLPADPQSMIDHWSEVTTARALGLRYVMMVQEAIPTIVQGLTVVAGASGVALFHCSAGKDRTGIFALLEEWVSARPGTDDVHALVCVFAPDASGFGSEEFERLFRRRLVLSLEDPVLREKYWSDHVARRRIAVIEILEQAKRSGEIREDPDVEGPPDGASPLSLQRRLDARPAGCRAFTEVTAQGRSSLSLV